jgi:DeoR family glycerol-3-phosphate regulon repressor
VLDFTESDAQVTNAILENSRFRYLAADASKWTSAAAVRVAPFSDFSAFITDHLPDDPAVAARLRESGLSVVTCDSIEADGDA